MAVDFTLTTFNIYVKATFNNKVVFSVIATLVKPSFSGAILYWLSLAFAQVAGLRLGWINVSIRWWRIVWCGVEMLGASCGSNGNLSFFMVSRQNVFRLFFGLIPANVFKTKKILIYFLFPLYNSNGLCNT